MGFNAVIFSYIKYYIESNCKSYLPKQTGHENVEHRFNMFITFRISKTVLPFQGCQTKNAHNNCLI